jgi:hypothetical protein
MKSKFSSVEKTKMLNEVLSNTLFYIAAFENKLNSVMNHKDVTNDQDLARQINIYTTIITLLNDSIHSCHGYALTMYDKDMIRNRIANQRKAFEEGIVNPCVCIDCKLRGYDHEQWNKVASPELDMEGISDTIKRAANTNTDTAKN